MNTLSTFLPVDRRRALRDSRPMPDRVYGAALFADISGFTPLTATLRHELGARRGAEEVIRHLDGVFATLIDHILRYNGNVIGFSGDAITCWFDDRPGAANSPNAAERATAAALELQAVMARLNAIRTPAGTEIPLAIKVAVAAGPARRFLAGDPATYVIEILAGATVDRAATAESLAERGEVIVSEEVLPHLSPPPVVAAWRTARHGRGHERYAVLAPGNAPCDPPPPDEAPELDDETARPWLLPPVYNQLRQGSAEFLAGLRPAVPLFVQFSGIDYDGDDDAGKKLDALVRHTQRVLDRYEGFLVQITIGDKGSYLYISFGAPVAHEDDSGRAAAAALELRDIPRALPYLAPLRIGISRGLVHSGAYGGPQRRTYSVTGNEVNVSARLMSHAAPGQILISGRVAEDVAGAFETRPLPPVHLKGLAEPFPVHELVARQEARRRPAHGGRPGQSDGMIGREAERARLDTALAELAAGRCATLLIDGAAGVGKSLLMEELARQARALGITPLTGAGDAIERSTPYFAWRPIFESLFMGAEQRAGGWREQLLDSLGSDARPLAPLLNAVLPLDLPENELTTQLTGEARQDNTQQLLIDLLLAQTGDRPLLLLFDDAHWIDSVSWALIRRVRREAEPLLLALGARPFGDDMPPFYAELLAQPDAVHLPLDTLSRPAVEELVARRLGVDAMPPEVMRLIHDKAEGHPFFSEELAYALRDAGLLRVAGGRATLAPGADLDALDFPTTIQGVITSRIDRLSPSQQLTVKVASVIGRIFAVRVLGGVYPAEGGEGQLLANLKRLERLDITPLETPEPELAYIFKHIVTQEVVYELMTYAQRRQLHEQTALWYERVDGDAARNYPLLAHHWRLAGDAAKAAAYYEKAGDNAFRDFANQEAVRFLEQALELAGPEVSAVRRARWRRLLAEARYRLTHVESSVEEYGRALALLDRPMPASTAGRVTGIGRALARQLVHRLAPGRFVGRATPEQREALLEASRVLEGSGEIYYNLGDFLTTLYCNFNAFNLAERAGPSPELMRSYANMASTMGVVSLHRAADSYRRHALALEPQIEDLPARAWARVTLSTLSVWTANWDGAEQEIGEALEIYSQLGDWRRWGVAAWLLPQVAQSRGQLERARDLWHELHAVAERSQDTRHEVRGRGGQYFNFLTLDQADEALACLNGMAAIMAGNPEMLPVEERLWYAAQAAWAARQGEWGRAREMADETLAAIGRARFKFDLLEVFATPAEVYLALWERGEADKASADKALKPLSGFARTYAFARPRALRLRGQFAHLQGNPRRAAELWQKSLAQADALAMPYERKLTELRITHYELRN